MILQTLTAGLLAFSTTPNTDDLVAIRVGKAETISNGTLEHAVIVVENGKIIAVGEDLPIERGIPIIDRPDWVATPGFVNCHSRIGMDGQNGMSFDPELKASSELYARQDLWQKVLETGETTIGIYPEGTGIPGQAVAIRPHGDSASDMIVQDSVYLKINLQSSPSSKKMVRDAFEKVDKHDEKVAKEREKWEKEQEKKKKKSKSKKDDDKKDADKEAAASDTKEDDGPDHFVAPEPDDNVVPFIALRKKELSALMSITKAADYLHLLDALSEEDIEWTLHAPLVGDRRNRQDIDLYEVADKVGEAERRVVFTSHMTLQIGTRRDRNLPAEFAAAGAQIVLLPRLDTVDAHASWIHDVGYLVASGLDRDAALAAMTLEAARGLGLEERVGSLDAGKDANIVLWNGDPFEPQTRIQAVMLEGEFVYGEVR